jgi:hypothetical protein
MPLIAGSDCDGQHTLMLCVQPCDPHRENRAFSAASWPQALSPQPTATAARSSRGGANGEPASAVDHAAHGVSQLTSWPVTPIPSARRFPPPWSVEERYNLNFRHFAALRSPTSWANFRLMQCSKSRLFDQLVGADEQVLVTGSGTADGYFPRACWSNTLSTASVMASTPVSIVGFGTGANKGEWLAGNCGPSPSRAAATRSGS